MNNATARARVSAALADIEISNAEPLDSQGAWLHVLSHLHPKYGGLSSAVPALANAISGSGTVATALTSFCLDGEYFAPDSCENVRIQYAPFGRLPWLVDASARHAFYDSVQLSSGLHIHGLWEHSTAAAAAAARRFAKPYVVSAHGMLQPWALSQKKVKKAFYAALIERANLRAAGCLHALTRAEADDYRNFGLRNPIAIIPNGVAVPQSSSSEIFLDAFPHLRGKRLVLFLGRIHPKKGLDILSRAWKHISAKWPDAHLVLAGPDPQNYRADLEAILNSLGVSDRVTFPGMLEQQCKWSAYRAAEAFVLPSYSEGLSVSVLEAMGMGLPVVVTKQCNLPEVSEYDCGWVIEPRADQLVSALNEVLNLRSPHAQQIANNGRRLVASRFSWQSVAQQMAAVYAWLQNGVIPTKVEIR